MHYSNGHSMNGGGRSRHRNSHPASNSIQFVSPFMDLSLTDDFFNGGFTSFSSAFGGSMNGGGGGAVKRVSTSTTFVNGKKLVTKRYVVNWSFEEMVNVLNRCYLYKIFLYLRW